jgi:cytochrome c oxidase subunit II
MTKFLGLPIDASHSGAGVDNLILYVHVLMAVLFVGWLTYFLYVLFRFRASRSPKADYAGVKHHGSLYIEIGVAVVEGGLLIGLAIPLWAVAVESFPSEEEEPTVIQVVGQQFGWQVRYPGFDGVFGAADARWATAANPLGLRVNVPDYALDPDDPDGHDDFLVLNDVVVPVDKPVIMHIGSLDVVHALMIKPMRVGQQAIPGLQIPVWFTPARIGTYQITCGQLCGSQHYAMKGHLMVVSEADYFAWKSDQVQKAMAGRNVLPDYGDDDFDF